MFRPIPKESCVHSKVNKDESAYESCYTIIRSREIANVKVGLNAFRVTEKPKELESTELSTGNTHPNYVNASKGKYTKDFNNNSFIPTKEILGLELVADPELLCKLDEAGLRRLLPIQSIPNRNKVF